MSDNTMPERLWIERISYIDETRYDGWEDDDGGTEYIRADVAAAQLAERDARIAELEADNDALLRMVRSYEDATPVTAETEA